MLPVPVLPWPIFGAGSVDPTLALAVWLLVGVDVDVWLLVGVDVWLLLEFPLLPVKAALAFALALPC